MSLQVMTNKAGEADQFLNALGRGRFDHQFFSRTFLNRTLHDGQLEYVENANATVNCLATSNRWGKTTVLANVHSHGCVYKTGLEPKFLNPDGTVDMQKWARTRYKTIHTADLSETALLVWEEMKKLRGESKFLDALITDLPLSKPPDITWLGGAVWSFRTLGDAAEGIDGNSFAKISMDEAGWIRWLQEKMDNVVRIRVADVRGEIHLVGTFKPGVSRDFYAFCMRASAYTGRGLSFAHGGVEEQGAELVEERLDASIKKYLREFFGREAARGNKLSAELQDHLGQLGITEDELADAIRGNV